MMRLLVRLQAADENGVVAFYEKGPGQGLERRGLATCTPIGAQAIRVRLTPEGKARVATLPGEPNRRALGTGAGRTGRSPVDEDFGGYGYAVSRADKS